jgi:hypothetical protein
VLDTLRPTTFPQSHEAIWFRVWEWRDDDGIHHRKHRGVGPDAEAERSDRSGCEPGGASERARCVPKIVCEILEPAQVSHVAHVLREPIHTPERNYSGSARRHRVETMADVVFRFHIEMERELG